jgi:hypothetical protein
MPGKQVKDWDKYHKVLAQLKKQGIPIGEAKERAAKIANADPSPKKKDS